MSVSVIPAGNLVPIETRALEGLPLAGAFNLFLAQNTGEAPATAPQGEEATLERARQLGINAEKDYSKVFSSQLDNIKQIITDNWQVIRASGEFRKAHPEVSTPGQFFKVLDNTVVTNNTETAFSSFEAAKQTTVLLKSAQAALLKAGLPPPGEKPTLEDLALQNASDYLDIMGNALLLRYLQSKQYSQITYPAGDSPEKTELIKNHGEKVLESEKNLDQLADLLGSSEKLFAQYTNQRIRLESPLIQK